MAEGKSVQQTVDILHKKLEQLGAVKQGSFCVDCETYHATGNVSGNIYLSVLYFSIGFGHKYVNRISKNTWEQDSIVALLSLYVKRGKDGQV